MIPSIVVRFFFVGLAAWMLCARTRYILEPLSTQPVIRHYLGEKLGIAPHINPEPFHVVYAVDNESPYYTHMFPRSVESLKKYNPYALVHSSAFDPESIEQYSETTFGRNIFTLSFPPRSTTVQLHSRSAQMIAWARYVSLMVSPSLPPSGWVLYLDADTVITESLEPLVHLANSVNWEEAIVMAMEMDNYRLGDKTYFNTSLLSQNYNLGNLHRNGFNTGVMVINIAMWRRLQISEKIFQLQYENTKLYNGTLYRYDDMSAANLILREAWTKLPEQYNCMNTPPVVSDDDIPIASNGKPCAIVHEAGPKKMRAFSMPMESHVHTPDVEL